MQGRVGHAGWGGSCKGGVGHAAGVIMLASCPFIIVIQYNFFQIQL